MPPPHAVAQLTARLRQERVTRLALMLLDQWSNIHLKDLCVESMDDRRRVCIGGRWLVNFGSDSFLGLDRDPALHQAICASLERWGTHNGASRAFNSVELCSEAERLLAQWLGAADTLIFPSVTLANAGLIPALAGKGDLLVVDRCAHDSIQQAAKIAAGNGATVKEWHPSTADRLDAILADGDYSGRVVALDGVYSMSGEVPPLGAIYEAADAHGAVLYVDDAHGTGVVGRQGRGAAIEALGPPESYLLVGSLSKAFSCMGAFVTCTPELKDILKIRSNTFVFGGPVPPPYLAAVCAVCELLMSPQGETLVARLRRRIDRLVGGLRAMSLRVFGGDAAIVALQVGDIEQTLEAGKWLFDRGYYVQSATYPAVPINGGLLRIQVNANHEVEAIDGLLEAIGELASRFPLPRA